jgi:PAS domain S-box-containing protein
MKSTEDGPAGDGDPPDWSGKIEAIANIIRNERDIDKLLWEICGAVLAIFQVDRAWLLFPCDPLAESWTVPIERTVAVHPGANLDGRPIAMTQDVAEIFRTALERDMPVVYGPGGLPLAENTKSFGVKSQLSMAIYPRVGKAWQFGLHQCAHERRWSGPEIKLFHIIGIMVAEALGNILLLRDLQQVNEGLERRIDERTAELNAEKLFAESLVDTAQAIVLVLDTQGRVVRYNPYMEELSGYPLAEVQNRDWFSIFLPHEDREKIRALFFGSSLSESRVQVNVNPIVTKTGAVRQVEWHNKALADQEGKVLGVLAIGQDISERVQTERDLQQAKDQAERANLAKSRFLAAASHDLRQPLQAMSLLLSALRSRRMDESARQILTDMKNALHVTEALLNALLDISKLEAHYFVPDRRDFHAGAFLQELREQFKAQAAERGVRIRLFPSAAILYSDIGLLGRVLQNFIANAIHHGQGERILLGCRRSGDNWRLEVWDRGPGIEAEHLDAIFEEFFQLGNPARDLNRGLGLGLAIAKRVADLLQLKIDVRSRVGRGSCFSVEVPSGSDLPRVDPRQPAPARVQPPREGLVLIVEDDRIVLGATERLLGQWGYRTRAAGSAEEALRLLDRGGERFSLALLDFRLPDDWNGVKLVSEIRRRLDYPLPAILLTGDTSAEKLLEVRESGLPVLHKPVDTARLYQLIAEQILRGE